MNLVIPSVLIERIRRDAGIAYPNECCGLLIGHGTAGGPMQITDLAPARNVAAEPYRHFELDPTVHLHWQRELRRSAQRIIGHYHSHPDGRAVPSATDRASIEEPGLVWVIVPVALGEAVGEIRAWILEGDAGPFQEIELIVDRGAVSGRGSSLR